MLWETNEFEFSFISLQGLSFCSSLLTGHSGKLSSPVELASLVKQQETTEWMALEKAEI